MGRKKNGTPVEANEEPTQDEGSEVTSLFDIYVDELVYAEVTTKPVIKSGKYQAKLGPITEKNFGQYPTWHDGAGHNRVRIDATLYDGDGVRVGKKSFDVSFEKFNYSIGTRGTHLDSVLYAQLQHAVVGDGKVSVGDTLTTASEAVVSIFGKETFKVKVGDLPGDRADAFLSKGKGVDQKVTVYLNANDDALRDHLLEKGYDSDFRVFGVSPAKKTVDDGGEFTTEA